MRLALLKNKCLLDLKRFSQEKVVKSEWNGLKIYLERETKKITPLFKREVNCLVAFLGTPQKQLTKIILITNPLDAYWRGYSFNIKGVGYLIVGPGAKRKEGRLIRHELLHLIAPAIQIPRKITTDQSHKHLIAEGYGGRQAVNNEYVVRSLNLLYERGVIKKNISQAIKHEESNFPHIRKVMQIAMTKLKRGDQ